MGDGWAIDSRKPHISNATGRESCTEHVEKAALATSGLLFSVNSGRIELSLSEGKKDTSRRSDVEAAKFSCLASVLVLQTRLIAACLVSLFSLNRRGEIIVAQNSALNSSRRRKNMIDGLVSIPLELSLNISVQICILD